MCQNHCRFCRHRAVALLWGVAIGIIICLAYIIWVVLFWRHLGYSPPRTFAKNSTIPLEVLPSTAPEKPPFIEEPIHIRQPIYVGVLTLEKYISSRATACNVTWAQHHLISKLEYFAQLTPKSQPSLSVINLTDIPAYDPWHQGKSFRMLDYICQHHIDNYDWFLRAVDDTYINIKNLNAFLSTLDKKKKVYVGHTTYPVDDLSYKLLQGGRYCMSGPGLILSRPLLKAMCPYLPQCLQHVSNATVDVEIARCIEQYTGIQCVDSAKLHDLFYHSHERNAFRLVEEFSGHENSISLHPVKTPWLMETLHKYYTKQTVTSVTTTLQSLIDSREKIGARLSHSNANLTKNSDDQRKEKRELPITFFSAINRTYCPVTCNPSQAMSGAQRVEVFEVVRLANISCRLGDLLRCHKFLGGTIQHFKTKTDFTVGMLCSDVRHTSRKSVTRVTLSKQLLPAQVRKYRITKPKSRLLLLVSADYSDPKLVDFLMAVKQLSNDFQEKLIMYLILFRTKEHVKHYHHIKHSQHTSHFVGDLNDWYSHSNKYIHLKTVPGNHTQNATSVYASVIKDMHDLYRDSVVLVTKPSVIFGIDFIKRCRSLVREGKQMYHPYPTRRVMMQHTQSSHPPRLINTLWTEDSTPMCIHISDLYDNRPLHTEYKPFRTKPLKITRSLDLDLHLDLL